jgi:hypothetical protein
MNTPAVKVVTFDIQDREILALLMTGYAFYRRSKEF